MRIGQLAVKTDVTADTIRYYERLGLLPAPARTASGYRQYPDAAATRVRLIRNAVRIGFPLRDVARFLHVREPICWRPFRPAPQRSTRVAAG